MFVNLDGHGADRMRRFTTENVQKPMAVLFIEDRPTGQKDKDGKTIKKHVEEVISVATIREPFGAHFQTTGLDSQQEARDLALFLRAGALKAPIDIVEERTIGPSLGQDNIDQGFDVVEMARAAGATFVARTTTYHVTQMADIVREAILHEGFSVVEIMSQCPTYFGRKNKLGSAVDMMKRMKELTTPIGSKAKQENPELIERGIFVQIDKPEYCSEYTKIIERAMGGR